MDKAYTLVGKILEQFQQLEDNLAILVYIESYNIFASSKTMNDIRVAARDEWRNIESKPLGIKLRKIKDLNFFENKNDIIVLEYLKSKRDYIAHNFFIDNKFGTEKELEDSLKILEDIYNTN